MPFKSEKQRKWMHANKPKMAKKWEKEEEAMDEYHKFRGKMTYKKKKKKKPIKKEARTINVEPNWEGVWRYFKHIQKTSPGQWSKMKGQFRASWINLQRMADKKGWKTESVNEGMKAFRAYRKMKEGIEDIITGIRILRGHIDDAP